MAKICECRKYAIFRLYLTINPAEPVYESFYGTVNIIWCIGEPIECPGSAWCAASTPKMTKKVDESLLRVAILNIFGQFFIWILSKTPFHPL